MSTLVSLRRQGCMPQASSVKGFCVVMPARNERPTVAGLVRRIKALHACEVVVVDDASSDGTGQAALEAGATVLRLRTRTGAWRAALAGMDHALALGYPAVVTFDADGQHLPETIAAVLGQVSDGSLDVCIGSCLGRAGPLKKTAWAVLRALAGCRVRDVTSGLRAYSRTAMESLIAGKADRLDYQDIGVLVFLVGNGFTVGEVAVGMDRRRYGRSRQFGTVADMARHFFTSSRLCLKARQAGKTGHPLSAAWFGRSG